MKYRACLSICFIAFFVGVIFTLAGDCLHCKDLVTTKNNHEARLIQSTSAYLIISRCAVKRARFRPCIAERLKITKFSLLVIMYLILCSGDVELNPGPAGRKPKFPCVICGKACRWGQRAIACDSCDQWFHASCLSFSPTIYEYLGRSNVSWTCCQCGMPNFSTTLFNDAISVNSSRYDCLSCVDAGGGGGHCTSVVEDLSDSDISLGPPLHSSSPKHAGPSKHAGSKSPPQHLQIMVINFQSIKNKKDLLGTSYVTFTVKFHS